MIQSLNLELTDNVFFDGNEVHILQLNGKKIWADKSNNVIIGITVNDVANYPMVELNVYKLDDNENLIDWGDGTVEVLNPTPYGEELGRASHTYTSNGDYDITISGSGLIGFAYSTSINSINNLDGIYTVKSAEGEGTGSYNHSYTPARFYKLGNICTEVNLPFGTLMADPVYPPPYQSKVCYIYNLNTFNFDGGENVGECYYNPSISFSSMMNQVNKVLYNNSSVQKDYVAGFEGDGYLILTSVGDAFDLTKIKDYPFTDVDYLNIPANSEVIFPETLTNFRKGCFKWNGTTTLKFLTPSGVEVNMPEKFTNSKTAFSITIYTDNETIKNYDWAGANLTATFYHLDGTAWA